MRRTQYFNSPNTCGSAPLVLEVLDDLTRFAGAVCSGSGQCSLTAQTQEDNTITRVTTCTTAPLQPSSLATRTNIYSDASCTNIISSFGYFNGCFPGTMSGLSRGASTRYACDSTGSTFQITYSAAGCTGTATACNRLNAGPSNSCVPYIFNAAQYQIATCSQISTNIPSICPSGGAPAPLTTPPPTTRPAANLDINRDGTINLLDVAAMMDQYGPCVASRACTADIAVPYDVVDIYDLTLLMTALPR